MTGFLVGNFAISATENKWIILEFRQKLPKINEDNTKEEITFRQHIIMNAEQAKSLKNILGSVIKDIENKYGEIKLIDSKVRIIKNKEKQGQSYIG